MGYLIEKIFQGFVWIGLTILQGFLFYIDICDAVLTTFLIWDMMVSKFDWNGWWALALGLTASLIIFIIFKNPIGFWIVAPIYSAAWACLFTILAKMFFFHGMTEIWFWIWVAAITAFMIWLHSGAQDREGIVEEFAAEEAAKSGR